MCGWMGVAPLEVEGPAWRCYGGAPRRLAGAGGPVASRKSPAEKETFFTCIRKVVAATHSEAAHTPQK